RSDTTVDHDAVRSILHGTKTAARPARRPCLARCPPRTFCPVAGTCSPPARPGDRWFCLPPAGDKRAEQNRRVTLAHTSVVQRHRPEYLSGKSARNFLHAPSILFPTVRAR